MSLLVAIGAQVADSGQGRSYKTPRRGRCEKGRRLQLEVALDEFAQFFAVFIAHVHEFDATTVGTDVADHGGEIDLAEAGADFQFDRVADAEFPRGG